jgi:hypothetical protein
MAPRFLFNLVFDEAEAPAGLSDREVANPSAQYRVDETHHPI